MKTTIFIGYFAAVLLLQTGDCAPSRTEKDRLMLQVDEDALLECKSTIGGHQCVWAKYVENQGSSIIAIGGGEQDPPERYELIDKPTEGDCSLTISKLEFSDSGTFTCMIEKDIYFKSIELFVGILPKDPVIHYHGKPTTEGQVITVEKTAKDIYLMCLVADGKPKAQVAWLIGDRLVDARLNEVDTDDITGVSTVRSHLVFSADQLSTEKYTQVGCVTYHSFIPDKKITSVLMMLI